MRLFPIWIAIIAILAAPAVASAAPVKQDERTKYVGLRHAAKKAKIPVGEKLAPEKSAKAHGDHIRSLRRKLAAYKQAKLARQMSSVQASWYGPGLYGNRTACGQTLTPGTAGVAHKSLPCGTRIYMCAVRCATTTVIDRGPYVGNRVFDLTAPTKNAIGFGSTGIVRYRIVS